MVGEVIESLKPGGKCGFPVVKNWLPNFFSKEKIRRIILRKEVIQPQVPLRLPCYDLVPITELIVGACLLTVSLATSDPPRFRGLTGGVYKAQEHIHRSIADLRLLAIPASCRRVAACNPN
jgi:hypothetical protein